MSDYLHMRAVIGSVLVSQALHSDGRWYDGQLSTCSV
jgi:hypothetical protein